MNKRKTFVGVAVLLAVLMLGVGYALITNITLNITGTAKGSPDADNFVVKFTGATTDKTSANENAVVTATVTDDLNATINVENLTAQGESVSATYTIYNDSEGLSADLSATVSNDNEGYFEVTQSLADTNIASGDETTITVTVKLIKTPVDTNPEANIGVAITADPVQP